MCKKKLDDDCDSDVGRDESLWMDTVSENQCGPAEVKRFKIMVPVSSIFKWFKKRFRR